MSILSYFSHLSLTKDQSSALVKIEEFLNGTKPVFILKGYAGSGKTTILKGIYQFLLDKKELPFMMAPTGRAAKILKEKIQCESTSTIHRAIYALDRLETKNNDSSDISEREFKYVFPIRNAETEGKGDILQKIIAIIDESSMISSMKSEQELFQFGTDCLLPDLLTFIKPHHGGKVIFVGDSAQLPPVADNKSAALDVSYFEEKTLEVDSYEMTEVVRHSIDSLILANATKVRQLLTVERRNELVYDLKEGEVESILPTTIIDLYCDQNVTPEINNSSIICYSNEQAQSYNNTIREKLYPLSKHIIASDIVMIVQNNYNTYGHDLYNGDMAKVISVSEILETQSAPVMCERGGKKRRETISLSFRNIELILEDGYSIHAKIIESLLNNKKPNLSVEEVKALYINFCIRNPELKPGTQAFKDSLRTDKYFNALRIKYGYAITCHKAQGGEWKTIFIDFTGRTGLNNDCLHWIYTATTRCSEKLYGLSIPHITPLGKMTFSTISKVGKAPSDTIYYPNTPQTPWHSINTMPCKRQKYFEILGKLDGTDYKIERIKSNPYMEEYFISGLSTEIRFDAIHDAAGFFKPFIPKGVTEETSEITTLLNSEYKTEINIPYYPSEPRATASNSHHFFQILTIQCGFV